MAGERRRLTAGERDAIAADAATRYVAGETWKQIGSAYGVTGEHVRRLTVARHDITYRRWGSRPVADVDTVLERRTAGETLDQIAAALGCSRQAVRTALESRQGPPASRYPVLGQRRAPTPTEVEQLMTLYGACPPAPRARPGARYTRGAEGWVLAEACAAVVADGVPMATLSRAIGRGTVFVQWLLTLHDLRPVPHRGRSTTRRTRSTSTPQHADD